MISNRDTLLFTFPPYEYFAKGLINNNLGVRGRFSLERFPNKELHLSLHDSVEKKNCLLIGSLNPPEVNLFSFLVLAHTLKKEGAQKVSAFIPYLSYSRHERKEPRKSQIASLVGNLLQASGIDDVFTFDLHSPLLNSLFPIPIFSISTATVFAHEIQKMAYESYTIVAPDQGAIRRCQEVASCLGTSTKEIAWVSKTRINKGVSHSVLHGNVQKKTLIIDDILDTGKTLISCCSKLLEYGVLEIVIMVTHGIWTGNEWQNLWNLGVQRIYCTNTLPLPGSLLPEQRITQLSVQSLLI